MFPDSLQATLAGFARCPGKCKSVSVCEAFKTSSGTLSHEGGGAPVEDIQCLGQHYMHRKALTLTPQCSLWID